MAFGNPLFLFLDGEVGEIFMAPVGPRGNVEHPAKDVGDLESEQAESHVGEALSFFWKLSHFRINISIVDVEWLFGSISNDVTTAIACRSAYHQGVKKGFNDGRIAAVIFRGSCIQYADLPPQSPPHLYLERREGKMAAISVNAKGLRNAYHESSQGPDLASIVVSTKQHQEDDKSLQYNHLVTVEKIGPRQSLLYAHAISAEQGGSVFAPPLHACFGCRACDCTVVDAEQECLQPFAGGIDIGKGIEHDGFKAGNVQYFYQWIHRLLVHLPELEGLLLGGMHGLHVYAGRAAAENEGLVLGRV